ncbi:AI-2E family transporter, partial [Patescibacteria group bacterium]|nr:AI-2E family transporter [Patescibacteria group bacterium]
MTVSKHFSLAQWFFLIICVGLIYLYWQVLQPFILALVTAAIFSVVLSPLHAKIIKKYNLPRLSALLILLIVFAVVLVPIFVLSILVVQQAGEVLDWSLSGVSWLQSIDIASQPLFLSLPELIQEKILAIDLVGAGQGVAEWVFNRLGDAVSGGVSLIFNTFIFFIALYYFLVHRDSIHKLLLELSPFKDTLDENIIRRIIMTVRSVVFGALIIAVIQSILATI